jgi:hypothetical protein
MNGVKRENRRGRPRARQIESAHDRNDQDGEQSVAKDCDKMIGQNGFAPQSVFHPKERVKQRIILRRSGRLRPNAREPVNRTKVGTRDVNIVVPNRLTVPGRRVSQKRDGEKRQREQPIATRHHLRRRTESARRPNQRSARAAFFRRRRIRKQVCRPWP